MATRPLLHSTLCLKDKPGVVGLLIFRYIIGCHRKGLGETLEPHFNHEKSDNYYDSLRRIIFFDLVVPRRFSSA